MAGPKPIGRWIVAWVAGTGGFLVVMLVFAGKATPEGFQIVAAADSWARALGLLIAAAVAGMVVPLIAWHDLPGLALCSVGAGLVAAGHFGRTLSRGEFKSPANYWLSVVIEAVLLAVALAVAHAVNALLIQKMVGVERREAWRREVRIGPRRAARSPAGGIFLVIGAAMIVAVAAAYLINGGKQGEGAAALCIALTALVAALLMHRAAPVRDALWFALSVPLWTALLPAIGWVLVSATGDDTLPLAIAMSSVGTNPFAFCGAGVVGAMLGFWISYRG
jgi:hypothetical protein